MGGRLCLRTFAATVVVFLTNARSALAVENVTCEGIIDLRTLPSTFSHNTSDFTTPPMNLMPLLATYGYNTQSAATGTSMNKTTDGDVPARVFFATLQPGQTLKVTQTSENYDSRRILRSGPGDCPGELAVMHRYDGEDASVMWQNTLTQPEKIYYIQTGNKSSSNGTFELEVEIKTPKCYADPIDLATESTNSSKWRAYNITSHASTNHRIHLDRTVYGTPSNDTGAICGGIPEGILASASARVFVVTLPKGKTVKFRQNPSAIGSSNATRHLLRYGGDCPGDVLVTCIGDEIEMRWENKNSTEQKVYYIQSAAPGDDADFALEWTIESEGSEDTFSLLAGGIVSGIMALGVGVSVGWNLRRRRRMEQTILPTSAK